MELITIRLRIVFMKGKQMKKVKNNNGHNDGDLGNAERLIFKRHKGIMNGLSLFKVNIS